MTRYYFIMYGFLWHLHKLTYLQIGSTVRASSMLRWFRSTCLHPVMTLWSSCAVHLPWSSLPVFPTWTNWATGRANASSIRTFSKLRAQTQITPKILSCTHSYLINMALQIWSYIAKIFFVDIKCLSASLSRGNCLFIFKAYNAIIWYRDCLLYP